MPSSVWPESLVPLDPPGLTWAAGVSVGRFQLRRLVGRGGQADVWLAFDPLLEREVAVKLLHKDASADDARVAQWLQEARSVSRLTHPNIIPVFEADVHEGQPYLVFEFVPGQTLADWVRARGAIPVHEAVGLAIEIFDALAAAHASGIVHRDLKPSNVLVDAAGHARVMDFGIAARIEEPAGTQARPVGGTPGYIAPEAIAGDLPTPAMDLYALTVVLVELLCGHRLMDAKDPERLLQWVVDHELTLPKDLPSEVDDALRAILSRGLARDPRRRPSSALAYREELRKWLRPVSDAMSGVDALSGTVEFLLRRMRHKSDFPVMSGTVVRILSISSSDRESVATLTNEILKDIALTQKLLRLVNTPFYARGSAVSTVSRAVSLVGFNGIRNMALSLVLLEHMQDKMHANVLKEEFFRSLMAGSIAVELCGVRGEAEEAFLAAMFKNLGRLLAEYYFPEEARAVRALMVGPDAVNEAQASVMVLGINYEQLGLGIGHAWCLPVNIQYSMRTPAGPAPLAPPPELADRLRWLALVANEMADAMLQSKPEEAMTEAARAGKKYLRCLSMDTRALEDATLRARDKLVELAHAADLHMPENSAAARLLEASGMAASSAPNLVEKFELQATLPVTPEQVAAMVARSQPVSEMLAAGIQDITNAMVEDFKLPDVLRMILETMYRAMEFRHIVFCMRDTKRDALTGRFGLGKGVEALVKHFEVPLSLSEPNLFSVVCAKGVDTMIIDSSEPRVVERLPAWYREHVHAPTFLLLPLLLKKKPLGLIYADHGASGDLHLGEKELALLRTLRNQAVMAFRQSA
jgi:serine/threonine protein kinase